MPFEPSLERIAREAECDTATASLAVTAALRVLHRVAVTDSKHLTAALMHSFWLFGSEACYHFGGILEESRVKTDPELPWSETLERFAPHLRPYRSVVEKWLLAEGEEADTHG